MIAVDALDGNLSYKNVQQMCPVRVANFLYSVINIAFLQLQKNDY